jgi:hypothetical protein
MQNQAPPCSGLDAFFPAMDGHPKSFALRTFDTFVALYGRICFPRKLQVTRTYELASTWARMSPSLTEPPSMSSSYLEKALQIKQRSWQRRHTRHRADFLVKARVLRTDGYLEIPGRCSDIGHGGMGIVLTEEAPKGEVLSLEFQFPGHTECTVVRTIVRYRKGFVHGVEFLGLSPEQQETVDSFCEGLAPVG